MKKALLFLIILISLINVASGQWVKCDNNKIIGKIIYNITTKDNTVYVFADEKISYSTNNGKTWFRIFTSDAGINSITNLFISNKYFYLGCMYHLFVSSDNGKNWKDIIADNFNYHTIQSLVADNEYILVNTDSGLYQSVNNGNKWDQISRENYNILFTHNSKFYQGTWLGHLYVTDDYGDNWKEIFNSAPVIRTINEFQDKVYIGTDLGLYVSTDKDKAWKNLTYNFCDLQVTSCSILNNDIFIIANPGFQNSDSENISFVYHSSDNGQNWIKQDKGLLKGDSCTAISIINDYVFLGTTNGLYRAKLTDFGISSMQDPFSDSSQVIISPNPVTSNITISYPNIETGSVSITITNSLGMEMKHFSPAELEGQSMISCSTEDLTPGIYYCILSSGRKKVTKRFVVIR